MLVAVDEVSGRIPPVQGILQPDGHMYLRDSKNAALLGRLDDVGPHPFGVDPLAIVRSVMTGRSRRTPISVTFCTM